MQYSRQHLRSAAVRAALAALGLGASIFALEERALAGPSDTVPNTVASTTASSESSEQPAWMKKMAGSSAELGTYIGSGSFYSSAYHDNYASVSLYVRPSWDLGTRYKLAVTARFYFEEELTLPDVPNGRRFTPYDAWLSLVAKNLHTFEASKLVVGGIGRLILPLSYESRYANLVTGLGIGATLGREFEFGSDPAPERRFKLSLTLIELFTKYIHTSDFRGNGAGDSTGCRNAAASGTSAGSAAPGAEGPAASDRCGGPINSSFGLRHAGVVALSRGKLGVSLTLLVDNTFLYDVPRDQYTADKAVDRGREDITWGIVSFSYSLTDHVSLGVGLSSLQPALDSQSKNLRFPFFDFSGATANNYTQAFASLSGNL